MKISGINFPRPLLDALRDDRLVIFAGAGVSMGQPAGLPNFKDLTEAIAHGTGEKKSAGESEDHFLSRLQHKGVKVHCQAVKELSKNNPQPTNLHHDLLRLYSKPKSICIVTTNFDTLFEKAAEGKFGSEPEVYRAPALPLGTKFNGIVHVHGSLGCAEDMVLTDADFGRAYLTEGWARRFLVELFQSYTVLFVGYSHSDIVMSYLVRALSTDNTKPRFALMPDTYDTQQWSLLGIKPILYQKSSDNDHSALYQGVKALANYASRGILDWQHEITEIVKAPPSSLDDEALDIINDALSDLTRTRFFTDVAEHQEWIGWLEQNNHLNKLFGTGNFGELNDQAVQLALWLVQTFLCDHSTMLFLLIGRKTMQIHPDFWTVLADRVMSEQDHPLDDHTLARWVSLLLATSPQPPNISVLFQLGECCAKVGLTDSLLEIFDAMITGRPLLEPGFGVPENGIVLPVKAKWKFGRFKQDSTWITKLWEEGLKPNLEKVADPLLEKTIRHLKVQHQTLQTWQATDSRLDTTSYGRSAIEPHEQNKFHKAVDVLIDAARDCLEYLAMSQPLRAAFWCDRLVSENAPILQRLAVHTLPLRKDLTSEEKIDWLLANILLHSSPARHEIFHSVYAIYPEISPEKRQAVINKILSDIWPQGDGNWECYTAYRHFVWLYWLHRSDSDCALAKRYLDNLSERYPDFQPPKYPDFTHYAEFGPTELQSPWNAEELLSQPASQWSDELMSYGKRDFEPARNELLQEVEKAATINFRWGLDLADVLADSNHWGSDLWPSLMRAWSCELDESNHRKVLGRLAEVELYSEQAPHIADVLCRLVKNGGRPYAADLLADANPIATALWDHFEQNEQSSPTDYDLKSQDWFTQALKHSAGVLTEFWLGSFRLWYNNQNPKPDTLGDEYSRAFSRVVDNTNHIGRLGKAILSIHLELLFTIDENWTTRYLVPLFKDTNNPDCQAVWSGFLYGYLSPPIAEALQDAFLAVVQHIGDLFQDSTSVRKRFVEFYTIMVVHLVEDPLDSWIPKFFEQSAVEDRRTLALNIGSHLENMDDTRRQEWWGRWLRQYWENRLQGIPAPLNDHEVEAMLGWLLHLKELFPEAVVFAIQMPVPPLEEDRIIYRLKGEGLSSRYPEATVKLLVYLAGSQSFTSGSHSPIRHMSELIGELCLLDLPEGLSTQLAELTAKLGLRDALYTTMTKPEASQTGE